MGQQFGRYQIIDQLGAGGMATVYRALDPRVQREVALKVLPRNYLENSMFRQRFEREAQTVASLEHRAIVPIYDYGEHEGQPFFVMQLMGGGTLADRLNRGPLPINEIENYLERIGDALDKAHAKGIVHRDLKPANILLDNHGTPYLSDFGIVRVDAATRLTAVGGMIGTLAYMSPEQVLGKENIDGRSDIYALGAVLFEMLTGRQPYASETDMGLAMAHVNEPIPKLQEAAPQLAATYQPIIDRAMAKQCETRFQNGSALTTAFHKVKSGGTIFEPPSAVGNDSWDRTQIDRPSDFHSAKPATPAAKPTETAERRSPRKLIGAVLAVLLLFGCIGSYVVYNFVLPQQTIEPAALAVTEPDATVAALVATVTQQAVEAANLVATEASVPESTAVTPIVAVVTEIIPTVENTPSPTEPPTATIEPTATNDPRPVHDQLGQTVGGQIINVVRFGNGPHHLLFIGGVHEGAAPATAAITNQLINYLEDNPGEVSAAVTIHIVPSLNPESDHAPGELAGRMNKNNVDINRNWDCLWKKDAKWRGSIIANSGGSAPFSEPEVRSLRDYIFDVQPEAVIVWFALFKDGLISPGWCNEPGSNSVVDESWALASRYGRASGYAIADYETSADQIINGDLNNWLDSEGIVNFAVILPDYEQVNWSQDLAGVKAVFQAYAEK